MLLYLGAAHASAQCIDETIRDELNARRRYRGLQERLFLKAGRHELSLQGGLYAADLLSSSYVVGGAYTYHVSESLGLEASVGYSHAKSELVQIIEQERGVNILRLNSPIWIYQGNVLWSIAYGKMRWFGSSISRFDLYLALGAGITDNQSAENVTFSGGVGMKFYMNPWLAWRVDIRDHVVPERVFGVSTISNNLVATMGLSTFIPFGF